MSNIPKVELDTIQDSYSSIIKEDLQKMNMEEFKVFIEEKDNLFRQRQPNIHEFIHSLLDMHINEYGGKLETPHLVLYIMIIIDSIYSQEENEEIRKLFDN